LLDSKASAGFGGSHKSRLQGIFLHLYFNMPSMLEIAPTYCSS